MSTPGYLSTASIVSVKTVLRIALVIATVFLFVSFNSSLKSDRAPVQHDFESWLQTTKRAIAASKGSSPNVVIALRSDRADFKADWQISLQETGSSDRVVRLLDLANAANIFSKGAPNDPNLMRLTISDGSKEFAAAFAPADIAANVEAGNLVRLFQLYAVEMPTEPQAAAMAASAASKFDQENRGDEGVLTADKANQGE